MQTLNEQGYWPEESEISKPGFGQNMEDEKERLSPRYSTRLSEIIIIHV